MRLISIVIPVYNEEENIKQLYAELCEMANSSGLHCEFVFVDDGSRDRTVPLLAQTAAGDARVRVVVLRRNFGQTAGLAAGFDYAQGEVVVAMDGDLQNDPAAIPQMIAKLDEGYDIVAGWRKNRQDRMLTRKIPSLLANRLISKTTNVKLHDYGCTLKVFRAEVVKNLNLYGEMHRFIPALAAQMGVRIAEVPVNHRARLYGQSKYGISRTFRVVLDLLTVNFFLGFATRPIHMFGGIGLLSGGLGLLMLSVLAVQRLVFDMSIGSRPALLVGVMLVLIGLQFICFGLLAEILVRTYHESQGKRIYAVREVLRLDEAKTDESVGRKVVRAI